MTKSTILITGAAGFIGSSLADKLLDNGYSVIGIDNFNDYCKPEIKEINIKNAIRDKRFKLYREDILNLEKLRNIFKMENPDIVIHLAARAGVRQSISDPKVYGEVNVVGTVNLLKLAVDFKIKKFIFGSSSSVYGNSKSLPFAEDDSCDKIISPYGASKRSAEFFVEAFNKSSGLKCVILRLFTVYGPRGRSDMAPAIFTKAILNDELIQQFGDGSTSRDYTYIDDIVQGLIKSIEIDLGFEIINLGSNNPITLKKFIEIIENISRKKARVNKVSLQLGDVSKTWAGISKANKYLGWQPKTKLDEGLAKYIAWFQENQAT